MLWRCTVHGTPRVSHVRGRVLTVVARVGSTQAEFSDSDDGFGMGGFGGNNSDDMAMMMAMGKGAGGAGLDSMALGPDAGGAGDDFHPYVFLEFVTSIQG